MKFGFKLNQPSTIRGLMWILFGIVGCIISIRKNDVELLYVFGPFIANGLAGALIDDTKKVIKKQKTLN